MDGRKEDFQILNLKLNSRKNQNSVNLRHHNLYV